MPRFDASYFPQYNALTISERLFLRTCCYFPPRPRRVNSAEDLSGTEMFHQKWTNAFGEQVWVNIADKTVLDLGCGAGGYTLALAEAGAGRVIGIDIRNDFVHAASLSESRGYKNCEFILGSIEQMSDSCVDIVFSHDSFEHFENPKKILNEMIRVTRPGGMLYIKFGPTWANPWGRHMSGTIRKDRPWIHLIVPERTVMRCHSVYHNHSPLREHYSQLDGGLNKMTVRKFRRLLKERGIQIVEFKIIPTFSLDVLMKFPVTSELFSSGVRAICIKK